MRIINHTKDRIISDSTTLCQTFLSKGRGLMFKKKLEFGESLVLMGKKDSITHSEIHMFFVFFPIDVLWVNSQGQVVDLRTNIKPFTPLAAPKKPAKFVIELPAGMIERTQTEQEDKITFIK